MGTANTYTSTIPGQVVQKTFSGTAGQQLGLTLSSFTTSVSGATLYVIVYKPDGTQLTSNVYGGADHAHAVHWICRCCPPPAPTPCRCFRIRPNSQLTTTFSGQVLVTGDVSGTLATNGTATAVRLAQAGQTARVTFSGTAGRDWRCMYRALT